MNRWGYLVNGIRCISSTVVAALVLVTSVCAAEPELIAELGSRQVYEGESVDYTVFLNNVEDAVELQLNGFTDFEVRFRGQRREDQEAQYIINGRRTVIRRHGFKYHYTLTPKNTGTLQVPAPVAEVDGQKVVGNICQLVVGEIEPQDIAILEVSADPPSVYMMQPFRVTLKVAVKGIGGEYRENNPMVGVSRQPPQLRFAWADDDQLPAGITPETPADRWLRSLKASSGSGFAINDHREATSIFDFSFDMNSRSRAMGFLPTARRTQRPDLDGDETEYWEFSFEREFTAAEVGQFSFGPVTLKGTFAVSSGSFGRLRGEDVIAVAKPITVEVKDAPLEGRPDSYVGGVGQFEVASQLTPTQVRVGEPMTLALTITGRGTLDRIAAPICRLWRKSRRISKSTTPRRKHAETAKALPIACGRVRPASPSFRQFRFPFLM